MIVGELKEDGLVLCGAAGDSRDVVARLIQLVRRPRQRSRSDDSGLKRVEQQHRLSLEKRKFDGTAEHADAERRFLGRLERRRHDQIFSGFQRTPLTDLPGVGVLRVEQRFVFLEERLRQTLGDLGRLRLQVVEAVEREAYHLRLHHAVLVQRDDDVLAFVKDQLQLRVYVERVGVVPAAAG